MTRSAAPEPHLLLYAHASPAQLSQAIITAREALFPYYPSLDWPQWHQAFKALEPTLKLEAGQVTMTPEGLSELALHLETLILPVGAAPANQLAHKPEPAQLRELLPQEAKKTYLIRVEILESLSRVSFWRRESKSALVNLALTQFLSQYPESQIPIPNVSSRL
jgi:hypothetical protein